MLQQGVNQAVDCNRRLAYDNPILRLGLTQRASLQQERAVADRRDRLSVAVSLIEEMDCQTRFRQRSCGAATLVRPQRRKSQMARWELRG
jgi:hypothetical protein